MDKVIFWDFDGTLVKPSQRFCDFLYDALSEFNYNIEKVELEEFLKTVYPWLNYDISYQNKVDDWWGYFLQKLQPLYLKYGVHQSDWGKINLSYKQKVTTVNSYQLYEDAVSVLKKCQDLGYKNYLLTNNYPELEHFVKDFKLDKYFTKLIVSGLIGYEKPRKELYNYAKNIADCNSGFMVGDNPVADIQGGKNAGLTTVLVHNESPSCADYTFKTLSQILEILSKQIKKV